MIIESRPEENRIQILNGSVLDYHDLIKFSQELFESAIEMADHKCKGFEDKKKVLIDIRNSLEGYI